MNFSDRLKRPIRVAIIGSTAREHALLRKIIQSPFCGEVLVIPGNEAMMHDFSDVRVQIQNIKIEDHAHIIASLREFACSFVLISSVDLIENGFAEHLRTNGFVVFAPSNSAVKIETSRKNLKEILIRNKIPTAEFEKLDEAFFEKAEASLFVLDDLAKRLGGYPIVLKYDGVVIGTAGTGVKTCHDGKDCLEFLKRFFLNPEYEIKEVVAERLLRGHELGLYALVCGEKYLLMDPVYEHKRLNEGGIGPNTGGMGSYSPVPWFPIEKAQIIGKMVFPPLLSELSKKNLPYFGMLNVNLMLADNKCWVIEFNCKFGDPETQTLLARLDSDLLPLIYAVAMESAGKAEPPGSYFDEAVRFYPLKWSKNAAVTSVVVGKGYPMEAVKTGYGLELKSVDTKKVQIHFSSVKKQSDRFVVTGSRILCLTATAPTVAEAAKIVADEIQKIQADEIHFRRDIGTPRGPL